MSNIVGILLAAGRSQRFGADKRVQPLANGVPLGIQALRQLRAALPDCIVVTRPHTDTFTRLVKAEDVPFIECPHAEQGMGASLAYAVQARTNATGWIIALADMPFIQVATIQAVKQLLQQGKPLVAPSYRGQRGHPVGFAQSFFTELSQLTGDSGARIILQRHRQDLTVFDSDDAGVLRDIDQLADLDMS